MLGGAHLCGRGRGRRRAVRQGTLAPRIRQRWALKDTVFLLGVHPPLQTRPVLRHHYSGQEQGGRQKQDAMSGAPGAPFLQVAGLFHQQLTVHCKKVPLLTLNRSPDLSFINKTELPPIPCNCYAEIKCSKCTMNSSFCN